jgi:hypothetical protein
LNKAPALAKSVRSATFTKERIPESEYNGHNNEKQHRGDR